jgi:hypothetical protein
MKLQKSTTLIGIFTVFAIFGLLFTACEQLTNFKLRGSYDN